MQAVEFRASIKDGIIQIPEQFRDRIRGDVRVIVLTDDTMEETRPSMIEELLSHPLEVDNFVPLTRSGIYERQ